MWGNRIRYFELLEPQRSAGWFKARMCRITASTYEKIMGYSLFGPAEEERDIIVGKKPQKESNENMERGKKMEEPTRDYFHENGLPPGTIMYEPSLCIGKTTYDFPFIDEIWPEQWRGKRLSDIFGTQAENPLHPNFFIGGSPDFIAKFLNGDEKNGEIKFPKKMYEQLLLKINTPNWTPSIGWYKTKCPKLLSKKQVEQNKKYGYRRTNGLALPYDHLWTSHLYQMIGCMAITGNKSCYYVVGSFEPKPGLFYWEEIQFDIELWHTLIYPNLVYAVENLIKPSMSQEQIKYYIQENKYLQSISDKDEFKIIPWI